MNMFGVPKYTINNLQYSDCCSDWENFEDYPGDFQEF
jgi:hypothetical protein